MSDKWDGAYARLSQLYDLVWSALALIVFWVTGAAMFSQIEGWSYGWVITPCHLLAC